MDSLACRRGSALALATLLLAVGAAAQPPAASRKGTVEKVTVPGASLAGNLEKDSADRDVFIYLPPGYASNRSQRYPVVYLLHGYGLTAERWMAFSNVADGADAAIAAGTMKEMILVNPDANTVHGGSMYSASPTIGDWETFIAEDLVAFVDERYRTLADRASRGLAGHSMGGYGTLRIGMKRPDVFAAMYPMSSCCLIDNNILGGAGGRGGAAAGAGARGAQPAASAPAPAAAATAAPPATPAAAPAAATAPAAARRTAAAPPAPAAAQGARGDGARGRGAGAAGRGRGGFGNVQFALAAAWAPNPNNPPQFFDLPVVDGVPQPLVIAKFAANSPYVMVPQYLTNLKKYKAIMIDVGTQDGLAASNRQLAESLTAFGIQHTFETYEGDHNNRVPQRIETRVLPFFSANLSFTAMRR
jgi:enterochelin esterase-like enzyme